MAHKIKIVDLDRPKLLQFRVDGNLDILIQNGKAIILEGSLGGITNETPPKYQHDCLDKFIYLGSFWPFSPKDNEPKVYDGYLHVGEETSILARYGNGEYDFVSSPVDLIDGASYKALQHFKNEINIDRIKDGVNKAG